MGHTYDSLYVQDDAGDVGFSASPRSEAAIDVANDKAKPIAYSGRIRKGGSKPKKGKDKARAMEGQIAMNKIGGRTDGGDGRVPEVG